MVKVDYYQSQTGEMPARDYIDGLTDSMKAEAISKIRKCLMAKETVDESKYVRKYQDYWILAIGIGALIFRINPSNEVEILLGVNSIQELDTPDFYAQLSKFSSPCEKPLSLGA
ncbi:MAG: hypothetical protein IPK73_30135 [Candidatus Obscuribacter sp.]|jgi:hypothetical protein|nr:hypothetical protein [Candidatus Obscuribacter sp.]